MSQNVQKNKKYSLKIEEIDRRSFSEKIFDFAKNLSSEGREKTQKGKLSNFFARWKLYCLLFSLGALSALAFAPLFLFPLLLVVLPLFIVFLFQAKNKSEAFIFGLWFGFGQFLVGLHWLVYPFNVYGDIPIWMRIVIIIMFNWALAFFSAFASLSIWLMAGRYSKDIQDLRERAFSIILIFTAIWNLTDFIRGHIFTGFPWNLSGYLFGFSDVLLQTTSIWGIYGLGIFVIFIAASPLWLLFSEKKFLPLGAVGFLSFSLIFFGHQRLQNETEFSEDVNVRIVQMNIDQKSKWDIERRSADFLRYLENSRGSEKGKKNIIIWPETAVIYNLMDSPHKRYQMGSVLDDDDILLTGFVRRMRWSEKGQPHLKIWNSMMAVGHKGQIIGLYDKKHLVPFGDYIPVPFVSFLKFIGLEDVFLKGVSFSVGRSSSTLSLPDLPSVGVLICYEIIFPGQIIGYNSRPEWLLNMSNDAWFGNFAGPAQHFLQTKVRAIEEGLPLIRAGGTGISAIIDPYGRVLKKISLNRQGIINYKLPLKIKDRVFYSYNYNWTFILLCFTIMILSKISYIIKR